MEAAEEEPGRTGIGLGWFVQKVTGAKHKGGKFGLANSVCVLVGKRQTGLAGSGKRQTCSVPISGASTIGSRWRMHSRVPSRRRRFISFHLSWPQKDPGSFFPSLAWGCQIGC